MPEYTSDPRIKALQLNLDPLKYGTFAEIGAGQEVAALFFKAGAASGTIAKTMSAYDMVFSDAIYGKEESGRYVCEPRLMKMISKEYELLELRLRGVRDPKTTFFAFANTVVALNYTKTNQGHGWLGVRFQIEPYGPTHDVVIHVNLLDNDNLMQQQAIGVIGTNLIYACFYYPNDIDKFMSSLYDGITKDRLEIDMMRFTGPEFNDVDNRIISLKLVLMGMTKAALFNPQGEVQQASEAFYKKNILFLRGRFRPPTHVNTDMFKTGYDIFIKDKEVDSSKVIMLAELTLNNLSNDGQIDTKDFIDRADILCAMGYSVLISNYHEYYKVVSYLSNITKVRLGLILGMINLNDLFKESYYQNLKGGILESFSALFSRNVKLFVYPAKDLKTGKIQQVADFVLPENLMDLYRYLLANDKLHDVENAKTEYLEIFSDQVIKMIKEGTPGWEKMVPAVVSESIINKKLFGYGSAQKV